MVKVYHGNVIYRILLRFCSKTLPVKWLWRTVTSACLMSRSSNPLGYAQHLSVRSPSFSCPGNGEHDSHASTVLRHGSQHPCPETSVKVVLQLDVLSTLHGTWFTPPCGPLTKQVSGPGSCGSMHLTAWPLCLKCLGGQARMCPIWPLWATRPRKYPRRTPRYIFIWIGRRFPNGLSKQGLLDMSDLCLIWGDANNSWWSIHRCFLFLSVVL